MQSCCAGILCGGKEEMLSKGVFKLVEIMMTVGREEMVEMAKKAMMTRMEEDDRLTEQQPRPIHKHLLLLLLLLRQHVPLCLSIQPLPLLPFPRPTHLSLRLPHFQHLQRFPASRLFGLLLTGERPSFLHVDFFSFRTCELQPDAPSIIHGR